MKQAKLLLLMLCALLGYTNVLAETVSPYTVDFNTNPGTSSHDFAVASSWGHIVPTSDYDGYGPYYMTYSYSAEEGIDGSGTLNAYKQYAGDNFGGEVVSDILVTPVVSGTIELYVKANNLANTSYPSFVEFYTLNEAATAKVEQISRFTADQYTPSSMACHS